MKGAAMLILILCFSKGLAKYECGRCKCCVNGTARCIPMADSSFDHCLDGCIDGYYGYECKHACYDNCLKCTDIKTCIKCRKGYFGELCTACPASCLICSSLHACYQCKHGFYNKRFTDCREICKPECKSCFSKDYCTECTLGRYGGHHCEHNCSGGCLNNTCEFSSGTCSEGCLDGFYGNACNMKCSHGCLDSICDKKYGECSKGCSPGYHGIKCTHFQTQDDFNTDVMIGGAVGGCSLLIILTVIIAVILLKKRLRRQKQPTSPSNNQDNEDRTYAYIEETEMNFDSNETKKTFKQRAYDNPSVKEATTPTTGEESAADKSSEHPIEYESLNATANVQSDYSALEVKDITGHGASDKGTQ